MAKSTIVTSPLSCSLSCCLTNPTKLDLPKPKTLNAKHQPMPVGLFADSARDTLRERGEAEPIGI